MIVPSISGFPRGVGSADRRLKVGARAGDDAPPGIPWDFRSVYDTWSEEVARWIRALGGLHADRDDILQEVFLVVRRRLGSFDGRNLAGWLFQITRHQVRDFQRRTWVRHIFTKRRSPRVETIVDGSRNPETALGHKEQERVLYEIIAKMRESRRTTFVLFDIERLSGEEIARILDVRLNTVWTRLYKARKDFFRLAEKYRVVHRLDDASETGRAAGRKKESKKGRSKG